jgi:hypothetical protein
LPEILVDKTVDFAHTKVHWLVREGDNTYKIAQHLCHTLDEIPGFNYECVRKMADALESELATAAAARGVGV